MNTLSQPVQYRATAHLVPTDTFTYRGKAYVILKANPKNYLIADKSGTRFTVDRRSPLVHTGSDAAWYREVMVAVQGTDTNGMPKFKVGDTVRITGRGAGKFEGREGLIERVNRTRYAVDVPGWGTVTVPFGMVAPVQ